MRWTITNGICTASVDDVQIRLDGTPTVAAAGADQTGATAICGTSTTLTGNAPVTGTGLWTVVSGAGGSFVSATNGGSVFNGVAGTTYTLQWTISNGVCASSPDQVDISFLKTPTVSNAGPDQNFCGAGVTLAGNSPAAGTGAWSFAPSNVGVGGSFGNAALFNSGFTGTAGQTYILRWTITNGICTASVDDVQIRLDGTPTVAAAGADQTGATAICGTSTTLTGNAPVTGTGLWTVVSGAGGSFVSATNGGSVFNGVAGTTYTLQWTISNGVCASSPDQVDISFLKTPTVSNAGPDQNFCGAGVTLAGNSPAAGTGAWSFAPSNVGVGGSFGNAALFNSGFTGTAGQTYILRWTITNGICTASVDDVQIRLDGTPTVAAAGADQTGATAICGTSTTLTGNAPVTGTGLWTVVSGAGGSFVSATNGGSVFNGVAGTTYTLQWTISNGVCASSPDQVDISFLKTPTVSNAGPDQNFCGAGVTLAGNSPAAGTGAWSFAPSNVGVGGSFGNAALFNSGFTGTAGQTYILRWTITNGICTASVDDVQIRLDGTPTVAAAGADQTGATAICGTSTTLTGNAPVTGTGLWTVVSGAGGSFVSATNGGSVFNGVAGTTYTLQWTISNGVCASSPDQVDISFLKTPTVSNAGPDQNFCGAGVTLAGNSPAAGTGAWSFAPSNVGVGGSFGNAALFNSGFTGTAGQTYILRWTITNGICTASVDDVQIRLDGTPTVAAAGADQTGATAICGTSTTLTGNAPVTGTGLWTVVSGAGGSFVSATNGGSVFNGVAGTTYTLQWTISNGVCASSPDQVDISFLKTPTVSAAGPDQNFCGAGVTLAGNSPAAGTGAWSFAPSNVGVGGSIWKRGTIQQWIYRNSRSDVYIEVDNQQRHMYRQCR